MVFCLIFFLQPVIVNMSFQLNLNPEKMPQIGKLKLKAGDVGNVAKTHYYPPLPSAPH